MESFRGFIKKKLLLIMRIASVLLLFVVLPRYLFIAADVEHAAFVQSPVKLGIENLTPQFLYHFSGAQNKGPRVALVTNHTGIDQSGRRTVDILRENGVNVIAMYTPEHGLSGAVAAEKNVSDGRDAATGIPVISYYKGHSQVRPFTQGELDGIDAFFFDMQDSGMRHYTYFPTLYKFMEIAGNSGKKMVVFDRPNPLGGTMEGPCVDKPYHSFISIASYPLRHGMTIGELALYCNKHSLRKRCDLFIVPMKGYDRFKHAGQELLVGLSPNIPNIESAKGYSFLGLLGELEKPFDVGCNTNVPFQFIGAERDVLPKESWYELKHALEGRGVHSKVLHMYNADKQKNFSGLQLDIPKIADFNGLPVLLAIIDHFKRHHTQPLRVKPIIHKSYGTADLKGYVDGTVSRQQLAEHGNKQLDTFYKHAQPHFIYKPYPRTHPL